MYCTVYSTGDGHAIMINPNCNMKLIYEYLRVMTNIPDSNEIDLCSADGRLMGIYDAECSMSGLQLLERRAIYYVFLFDYDRKTGELYNPRPMMHHYSVVFVPVLNKMKRTFGISRSERLSDEDAALLFEHILVSYQEKLQPTSTRSSMTILGSSSSPRRSKSIRTSKGFGSSNILKLWREEKKAALFQSHSEVEDDFGWALRYLEKRQSRISVLSKDLSSVNDYEPDETAVDTTKHDEPTTGKTSHVKKSDKRKKEKDTAQKAPLKRTEKLQQTAEPKIAYSTTSLHPSISLRHFFKSQHQFNIPDLPNLQNDTSSNSVEVKKKRKKFKKRKITSFRSKNSKQH